MLSAGNVKHFVFGSFISLSLEDEAEYRHSNMRITNEKCGQVHSELVSMLDGIEHTCYVLRICLGPSKSSGRIIYC